MLPLLLIHLFTSLYTHITPYTSREAETAIARHAPQGTRQQHNCTYIFCALYTGAIRRLTRTIFSGSRMTQQIQTHTHTHTHTSILPPSCFFPPFCVVLIVYQFAAPHENPLQGDGLPSVSLGKFGL